MGWKNDWEKVQHLEDILAKLAGHLIRLHVIQEHADRQGSYDQIFVECWLGLKEITEVRDDLSAHWHEIVEVIRQSKRLAAPDEPLKGEHD